MMIGRTTSYVLSAIAVLWICGTTTADVDLKQTFHPEKTPQLFQKDGVVRDATVQDRNGHSVPVDVQNRGNVQSRVARTVKLKQDRRRAFESGTNGNGYRLTVSGDRGGSVTSEIIYKFRAPEGKTFTGSFRVAARMAAWKLFNNSGSSVRIDYKFGHSWYWRDLVEVSAPEDTDETRLANKFDTFDSSPELRFDATGHQTVYVRLVLHSSFFPDNAQVYRVRFQGRTAAAGNERAVQEELDSPSTKTKTSFDLLKKKNRWGIPRHPGQVRLNWTDEGMRLKSQADAKMFYRRRVPVRGGRVSVTFHFEGDPARTTAGGLVFDGIRTEKDSTLRVLVFPEREVMQLGNERIEYDRLPENPYRYKLKLQFRKQRAALYWGGRKMAYVPVHYVRPGTSIGARVTEGTVRFSSLTVREGGSHGGEIAKLKDPVDVQFDFSEEHTTSLPSTWAEYWGTHYVSLNHQRAIEDAGVRFSAVRGYGGPAHGFGSAEDREDSPVHEGPFKGEQVRLALSDYRQRNRWAEPDDPTAADYMRQIAEHDVRTVFNLSMTDSSGTRLPYFHRDLNYWFLKLIYDRWPSIRKKIIWQIGNELVSTHWNPKGIKDAGKRKDNRSEVPDKMWRNGYDLRWKLDFYINNWFGPAVETIERVGQDVFGDRDALPIASGSVNPYNDENVWFLEQFMGSKFTGDAVQTLNGDPVWKHLDYLTVHYMFDVGTADHQQDGNEHRKRMDRYVKTYLETGKVEGIWITEAHGRAGQGPVTILRTGFRFLDWVADHRLSAEQARMFWWGEGERAGGSGKELARRLGRFFQDRDLTYAIDVLDNAAIYVLSGDAGGGTDCMVVCVVPARKADSVDLGSIRFPNANVDGSRWESRAMQYSALALPESVPVRVDSTGSSWKITLNRRISEPLVVWLKR